MQPFLAQPDDPDFAAAARRATCHLVKTRARQYARRPLTLEALFPGLSTAPPRTLVAIAAHLVEREARSPRRWFGFGGEVNLVNARARAFAGARAAPPGAAAGRTGRRHGYDGVSGQSSRPSKQNTSVPSAACPVFRVATMPQFERPARRRPVISSP